MSTPHASRHRALVTGGARGLGAHIAELLAKANIEVAITGRDSATLEIQADRLRGLGVQAFSHACALDDATATLEMARIIERDFGPIDILVNNAGIASSAPIHRFDVEAWDRAFALNSRAPALLASAFVPAMRSRGFGRIINIASIVGLEGAPYICAYGASKHALVGLTRCLGEELRNTGVTVNAICPGYIDTDIFRSAVDRLAQSQSLSQEDAANKILRSANQSRLLKPEDVAKWVLTLYRDEGAMQGECLRLCP